MNPLSTLAVRAFDADDQRAFARLSGDINPMHMDPIAARRTQAGAPVVHGVHAVAWAMNELLAREPDLAINRLKVRFDKFIYVGDTVTAIVSRHTEAEVELALMASGVRAVSITLGLGARQTIEASAARECVSLLSTPLDLDLGDLASAAGSFEFAQANGAVAAAFPQLSQALGSETVNGLLALSTLVGMHAPGLHSIFSKIAVTFTTSAGRARQLDYRVAKIQPVFRLLTVSVAGPGLEGSIDAFVRQPPVSQSSSADLRVHVAPAEFHGSRVLVVGGSRGLGEVTAKLLALGGADVALTYARGAAEAEAVATGLQAEGAACRALRLDINEPVAEQLPGDLGPISHLYYFATPPIFKQKAGLFSEAVFQQFNHAYATAFYDLCLAVLEANGGTALKVFYPSSVAVIEPTKDAVEYGMAKAAGEMLCAEMSRRIAGLDILVERLPRLPTDQTATVLPAKSASVVDTLLPIIRRMAT